MPTRTIFLLLVGLGLTNPLAAQTPTWDAELLGPAPAGWSNTVYRAVNDAGQVVGITTVAAARNAWIGAPGQGLQLLPMPAGANWAEANDVNASGLVVGFALFSGASRAVVWTPGPGGYAAMTLPAGADGQLPFDARGVNDRGDVVGKYGILFAGYVWNATAGTTKLPSTYLAYPAGVNNQRQVIGDTYRMDLDTLVVEDLGQPTGTGFNYIFTVLSEISDTGECGGYGNVASGQTQNKQAVRYTDGPAWVAFNAQPLTSANVMGIAASGDTAYQLGTFGNYVHVEGHGTVGLSATLAPSSAHFDLTGSFAPMISRGGRIVCTGVDTVAGQGGVVLLTPSGFEDLGGAGKGSRGAPILGGYGTIVAGAPTRLRLSAAAPNALAFLSASTSSTPVPVYGGLFQTNPALIVAILPTNALGRIDLTFAWPALPSGTLLYLQAGVQDAEGIGGVALANAVRGVTQ